MAQGRRVEQAASCALAVLGTDTGVGKSLVVALLTRGLRRLGRRVWVHKPVACGGWIDGQAEDGRLLGRLVGDDQPRESVCPYQFPLAASPHLAAAQAGVALDFDVMAASIAVLHGDHDLVVEGVGGLLVPLTPDRRTLGALMVHSGLPVLLVTRPDLGTLNHTSLSVDWARGHGLAILGLVISHGPGADPDDPAVQSAGREIPACTGVRLIAEIPWLGTEGAEAAPEELETGLAREVLTAVMQTRKIPARRRLPR